MTSPVRWTNRRHREQVTGGLGKFLHKITDRILQVNNIISSYSSKSTHTTRFKVTNEALLRDNWLQFRPRCWCCSLTSINCETMALNPPNGEWCKERRIKNHLVHLYFYFSLSAIGWWYRSTATPRTQWSRDSNMTSRASPWRRWTPSSKRKKEAEPGLSFIEANVEQATA